VKQRAARGVADEFRNVALGDERLNKRLGKMVERAGAMPASSFPSMVASVAEREAFYRFFENDDVAWEAILSPHYDATARRCREASRVRIAHDTSFFSYTGDRDGMGPIAGNKRGFGGHFSLAVSMGEERVPLGIVSLIPFVRQDRPKVRTKADKASRVLASRNTPREEKESGRWAEAALAVEQRLGAEVACVHVMDQEADDFALLAQLVDEGIRFVVRGSATRCLDKKQGYHVQEALDDNTAQLFRTVPLGARNAPGPNHTARREREAVLHIRATTIELPKPQHAQSDTAWLRMNVVEVLEPKPPVDVEPIQWVLYTTEPIETPEDLAAIVDDYRARWRIEEYFKALKSGCAIEKRQLESYDALLRAMALFVPIAWRLLAVRSLARDAGHRPASDMVDALQLEVLRFLAKDYKIPSTPTIKDVMLAIADIGGHIRQNGDPGWIVLGRGFDDFVKAEIVWRAALSQRGKK
jgi:Transposase DNA-binding/Transposase DDE domain